MEVNLLYAEVEQPFSANVTILVYNDTDYKHQVELISDWSNHVSTNADPKAYTSLNLDFRLNKKVDSPVKGAEFKLHCDQKNLKTSKGYKLNRFVIDATSVDKTDHFYQKVCFDKTALHHCGDSVRMSRGGVCGRRRPNG